MAVVEQLRLFVSVELSESCKQYVEQIQQEFIDSQLLHATFVDSMNLHCTIAFLGAVPADKLDAIKNALYAVQLPLFHVNLDQLLLWPSEKKAWLLVITLDNPLLSVLAEKIHHQLQELVSLEKRSFHAHITLARIKKINNHAKLIGFVRTFKIQRCSFAIDSFLLKQSILAQDRPVYTVIAQYHLLE